MQPTVGRIVHYQSYDTLGWEKSEPLAAIITQVIDNFGGGTFEVSLAVFNPSGLFFNTNAPYSEEPKPGHWNWPPRV